MRADGARCIRRPVGFGHRRLLRARAGNPVKRRRVWRVMERILNLAIRAPTVAPGMACADVYDLFSRDPDLLALAVVEDGRPIGLVNRHELILRLADRFGRPLFEKKPVERLMDRDPLIVDGEADIDDLGKRILTERPSALATGFIIVHRGRYHGIGSALLLLQAQMRRMQRHAEALEEAKLEAEAANRSKSMFLANMSHELRTPLNAIIGFTDFIRSETLGPIRPAEYAEYVEDVNTSGKHLLNVINAILDMSKIEANRLELNEEEIDPADLCHSACRMLRETAKRRGVEILLEVPDDLPDLLADPQFVRQILLNLLSNALKFSETGQTVRLAAELKADGGLVFTVSDEGIGIAEEDIERVLEPFGQAENSLTRSREGTGLGLPLCQALTEAHGGRLELESELGKGTTVRIHMPASRTLDTDHSTIRYLA
ncbi:MAG: CBS domain-containing protein [Alphaproteobacteria bacterium]|nr:MAG: CBS domain-containing protein [Alphaproteobacteria bacterium]